MTDEDDNHATLEGSPEISGYPTPLAFLLAMAQDGSCSPRLREKAVPGLRKPGSPSLDGCHVAPVPAGQLSERAMVADRLATLRVGRPPPATQPANARHERPRAQLGSGSQNTRPRRAAVVNLASNTATSPKTQPRRPWPSA
jgi:hypothetical protein